MPPCSSWCGESGRGPERDQFASRRAHEGPHAELAKGWLVANQHLEIVHDRGAVLVTDGGFGFGQVVGAGSTRGAGVGSST